MHWGEIRPDKIAFRQIDRDLSVTDESTWAELANQIQIVGSALLERGIAPGDRVVIAESEPLTYVRVLMGTLLIGAIAVPLPHSRGRRAHSLLKQVINVCQPRFGFRPASQDEEDSAGFFWLDGARAVESAQLQPPAVRVLADQPAILQFTSGTTAAPKAAQLSHSALSRQQFIIQDAFEHDENTHILGWLPLNHDLGLIGNVMQTVHLGGTCTLLPTRDFSSDPICWLRAISKFKATTSGGPDSAYALLCVLADQLDDDVLVDLDLSSWKRAVNGAEPIRNETLERFAKRFLPYGFDPLAQYNSYGLAEASLLVTTGRARDEDGSLPDEAHSGPVGQGVEVLIVDPDTCRPCSGDDMGEIWVSSPCLADRYWGNEAETRDRLFATLRTGSKASRFLRTGDFGRMQGHKLAVAGRIDSRFTVFGINIDAHEVEADAARAMGKLSVDRVAAFVEHGTGQAVLSLLVEASSSEQLDTYEMAARQSVLEFHGVSLSRVVFVRRGVIPRTTSGKPKRNRISALLSEGRLPQLRLKISTSQENQSFVQMVAQALGRPILESDLDRFFRELGGDSLAAVRLSGALARHKNLSLAPSEILGDISLRRLIGAAETSTQYERKVGDSNPSGSILSKTARAFLVQSQFDGGSGASALAWAAKIEGDCSEEALCSAWREVASSQDALRARLSADEVDILLDEPAPDIDVVDAALWEWEDVILDIRKRRAVSVSAGTPLVRPVLYRFDDDVLVFLIVAHHAVCDLTTLHHVFERLFTSVSSEQGAVDTQLEGLANIAPLVPEQMQPSSSKPVMIPTDLPLPIFADFSGAGLPTKISAQQMAYLGNLAQATGATVPEVLATLWTLLLMRMGESDVVDVAVPVDMRARYGMENAMGCGVEPVLLRASLNRETTVSQLISQIKDQLRSALAGHYSRMKPSDQVQPGPSAHLDAAFMWHDESAAGLLGLVDRTWHKKPHWGKKLQISPIGLPVDSVQHALAFNVAVDGMGGAVVRLDYATSRYSRDTAESLLSALNAMLDAAPQVDDTVAAVPLVSRAGLDAFSLWENGPDKGRPYAALIDQIRANARTSPDAVAIVCAQPCTLLGQALPKDISYDALDVHAEDLATKLAASGVGQQDLVALALPRSPVNVIAILAAMRLGAVFVPVSSDSRDTHNISAVEALGPCLWIADGSDGIPEPSLNVTEPWEKNQAFSTGQPPSQLPSAEDLAYVLHTSGSSGQPKAVAVPNSAIACRVANMVEELDICPDDVVLHKTSLSFDPSLWEVFATLVAGARLVVADQDDARDPDRLRSLVAETNVTILHFVPSMLAAYLAQCAHDPGLVSVRAIICSGEALRPKLRDQVLTCFGSRLTLWNYYGPTEATIDVLRQQATSGLISSIGRPVAETEIRILDRNGHRAAIGARGEIYIGGAQLAQCYLGQPQATQDAFVSLNGRRFYKTGDEARWLVSGQVDYLGRRDSQWKIRGQRVERGDIETQICCLPGVAEAAVALELDREGQGVLVAHVAPLPGEALPEPGDLRERAQEQLPAVMVPARFVVCESLPKTSGGKLDRNRLRADSEETDPSPELVDQPCMPLVPLFMQALRLDNVPVHRSFFDLGGDSLSAIRLVGLARAAQFPVTLPMLYAHPTPQDLYAAIERVKKRDAVAGPTDVSVSASSDGSFELSSAQNALLFLSETDPDYEVYVTSLLLSGVYAPELMQRSVQHIVNKHDFLRLHCTAAEQGGVRQIVAPEAEVQVTHHDLKSLSAVDQEKHLQTFLTEERARGFDWYQAPLIRVTVHVLSDNSFRLTLADPSLDGGCVATLLQEVVLGYERLLAGKVLAAERAPHVFRQFVAEERSIRNDPAAKAFWRDRLAKCEDHTETILRKPQGDNRCGRKMIRITGEVDRSMTDRLKTVARQNDLPLRSLLLAAHMATVWRLRGEMGGPIAAEVTGRPACFGADETLGIFNNILPNIIQTWPQQSWLDLARATFQAEREALPFRQFPLADIQAMARERTLVDSVFVYTDFRPYGDLQKDSVRLQDIWASDQTYAPMTTHVTRHPIDRALKLIIDFDERLVEEETARGYLIAWQEAVTELALQGHSPVCSSEPTPPMRWSTPEPLDILAVIAGQARQWPDRIAIEQEGVCLSYQALEQKMLSVANALQAKSVKAEDIVALDVPFGPDLVVSLLAVLYVGAAFLPLERNVGSEERNRQILDLAKPRLILSCDQGHGHTAPVLALSEALSHPAHGVSPTWCNSAAYVLFTSGTTGKPKGITVGREALAAYLGWAARHYDFDQGRGGAVVTGPDVDMSLTMLLAPLLRGRCVQMVRAPGDPTGLARFANDPSVGVLKISPSHLDALAAQNAIPAKGRWPHQLILGGEAIEARHCALLAGTDCDIVNEYGPSETTVGIMYRHVCSKSLDKGKVELGTSTDASYVQVPDATGRRLNVGARGELLLGGAQLARGYFGNPQLTAEYFVPDADGFGARLYRSGDMVACVAAGSVTFLGRKDNQVKVNGHRLEPNHIEATICTLAEVAGAVCAPINGPDGRTQVGLAVVLVSGETCPVPVMRAFLLKQLGHARAPGKIIIVDALPLTSSGKLNRTKAAQLIAGFKDSPRSDDIVLDWLENMSDDGAKKWLEVLDGVPMEALA